MVNPIGFFEVWPEKNLRSFLFPANISYVPYNINLVWLSASGYYCINKGNHLLWQF